MWFFSSIIIFPGYVRDSYRGPNPFSVDLFLMWDWSGIKAFDVGTSPTQNMPTQYAYNLG